ncbi:MAG: Bax inhibitor-1/YccA family protein [Ignavibacteriae bacterium]|nr:Bax inhibitor-1/YccA family protein [Ignavibacteriota bacterium]MCB9242701.1 Bax inhibitor-1/YccA family protein [Ignavibacteriales bacterium]
MDQEFVARYSGTPEQAAEISRSFLLKVYNWMAMGLAITGLVAFAVSRFVSVYVMQKYIFVFYGLLVFELILVWGLTWAIDKIPPFLGLLAFLFYAFLNGLTLSVIFYVYTSATLFMTFFVTAGTFIGMSVFGYITKIDLTKFGAFLYMGLFGLIIGTFANIFWANSTFYWLVTYAGVIIFVGLTAYDTQRIKKQAMETDGSDDAGKRASIMGALALYLDFINLFLFLLRIFGRRS